MTFKAFFEAAKPIITLGAATNATARQEIRDVVGELGDQLDRALNLADSYLVGAKFSQHDAELARYLADVDSTLMGSFLHHHVCAALYHLADKFEQLFNPTRFAVAWGDYQQIPKLVGELKNGEQVVLDDLRDIAGKLRDYSTDLHAGRMTRAQVLDAVEYHRVEVKRYRSEITTKTRQILRRL